MRGGGDGAAAPERPRSRSSRWRFRSPSRDSAASTLVHDDEHWTAGRGAVAGADRAELAVRGCFFS
uniref:Uncharacterized protein n=1 Tax=Setaria italica TaxID=4555 RepID=K3Y454_SETIT